MHSLRRVSGWIAVGLSTLLASIWAFWGIIENFHEGWYHDSLLQNLLMMFGQYLSPMLLFVALASESIQWPRLGAGLHAGVGLLALWWFYCLWPATLRS